MSRSLARYKYFLSVCLIVICQIGVSLLPNPSLAAGETVSVWVTTADQTKLLQPQANVTFAPDSGSNPTTIDINEATTYQTMDGFGASLTDSSAWDLNQLSAADREAVLQALFNPTTGIGLSFLRQPLGGSDFSLGNYAYDDTCCDVNDFSLNNGHDNAYIIPQLQRIKQINSQVRLLGTPWSPPRWMKTNNDWYGGGDANPAHLQTQYYAAYAQYFVKYVQQYAAQGLPIDFITIQNEPFNNNGGMPAMHMDPTEQANFIKNNLGPAFASAGITTKILVWDHNWDVASYPTSVLNDAAARQYVAGVGWHCYGGTPDAQTQVRNLYTNLGVWLTECSSGSWVTGGGSPGGSFGANLYRNVQQLVIRSTRNWAKSVVNWNLVLDQNNGPTNGPGACLTCYSVARVNTVNKTWSLDVDYYSLGHASKFVVPGATRIDSNTFDNNLEDVAFKNPDGSKVLIVINAGGSSSTFKVRWTGQSFSYTLPAGAVATFKWSNCVGCPTATPTATPAPRSAYNQIEAESFNVNSGLQTETCTDTGGGLDVGWADSNDYLQFNQIDFGSGAASIQARVASTTAIGRIEFHLDSTTGPLIGTVNFTNTGGWQTWVTNTATISGASGIHNLYLVYQGGASIGNLNWFKFISGGGPTNTPTRTNTPVPPTNTPTRTNTPVGPTNTPTATPSSGGALPRTGWIATASSTESGSSPANALDGNATTRWSTGLPQANGQWFQVDMTSAKTFNKIVLDSGTSTGDYPRGYQVFVSNDGTNWGSAVATGSGTGQVVTVTFATQSARYIKVVQTGSSGSWWSMHEFNVYNSAPLARTGWTATASSSPTDPCCTGDTPGNTLDGNASTRWSTGLAQANGQWFRVDMASTKTFNQIVLDSGTSTGDYPRGYQVFVSNDGTNWGSAIATGSGTGQVVTITFATQSARYIKVVQTGSVGNWWSMHEFNVYN
jgi:glucosylceramidase